MSETLPMAVVGAGHLGSIHARVLCELEEADLRCVVDSDADRAREIAARHDGVRALENADELPDDVKAVIVATPTVYHHAVASELLARGIHCLIEKPVSVTTDEARDLIDIARSSGAVLMVGHSERFNPVIRALDRHEVSPRFIDSQRVSPFSFRSADIGVVLDMMIHDIDIILHLIKSPVAGVHAVGVPVIGENEDLANARIVFENGAVANATASRVALKTERVMRLFSPEMYCTLDFQKKVGQIIRKGPALDSGELKIDPSVLDNITSPLEFMQRNLVRVEPLGIADAEPLAAEDRAFIEAIKNGTPPPVTGEHGLLALQTAKKIVASLKDSLQKAGH